MKDKLSEKENNSIPPHFIYWGVDKNIIENMNTIRFEETDNNNSLDEIFFYKEVFGKGFDFISSLDDMNKKDTDEPIYMHVYSYGGDLFTGFSLSDAVSNSRRPIHAVIQGIVASAGTLIALAANKVYMTENAQLMIHQLSTIAWGTYRDFQDEMKLQNDLMERLYRFYQKNSNLDQETIKDMLSHDTYINVDEAIRYGFVDEKWNSNSKKSQKKERKVMDESLEMISNTKNSEEKDSTDAVNKTQSLETLTISNEEAPNILDKLNDIFSASESEVENTDEDLNTVKELQQTIANQGSMIDEMRAEMQQMKEMLASIDTGVLNVQIAMPALAEHIALAIAGKKMSSVEKDVLNNRIQHPPFQPTTTSARVASRTNLSTADQLKLAGAPGI